jgi:hypothetical protein
MLFYAAEYVVTPFCIFFKKKSKEAEAEGNEQAMF